MPRHGASRFGDLDYDGHPVRSDVDADDATRRLVGGEQRGCCLDSELRSKIGVEDWSGRAQAGRVDCLRTGTGGLKGDGIGIACLLYTSDAADE